MEFHHAVDHFGNPGHPRLGRCSYSLDEWPSRPLTLAISPPDLPPDVPPSPEPEGGRLRRRGVIWLRRIGIGVGGLIVAVTVVSLVFNWVTEPPRTLAPGFGRYVRVGAAEVHYQQWGTAGSPIVLVPGAVESSIVWTAVGPLLGRRHRVYAVDMAWHGYTRYGGSMSLAAQASLLDGFITALHLQRPLLVGHSLGAAVIASVALDDPSKVGGVVFADGDGLPIGTGGWAEDLFREFLTHTPYLTSLIRIGERWDWAAHSAIKALCGAQCPGLTSPLVAQWIRPLGQQSEVDALKKWLVAGSYGLTNRQIAAITAPSEIIWGSGDTHTGGSLAATIANLHHPPVHIIEHADHLTMLADPAAFALAVEDAPVVIAQAGHHRS